VGQTVASTALPIDKQLMIVHDGSTGGTSAILDELAAEVTTWFSCRSRIGAKEQQFRQRFRASSPTLWSSKTPAPNTTQQMFLR
jgi:hypothetical protein